MKSIIFIALSILALTVTEKVRYNGPAPVAVTAGATWSWTYVASGLSDLFPTCAVTGSLTLEDTTFLQAKTANVLANYAGFADTDTFDYGLLLISMTATTAKAFAKGDPASLSIFAVCPSINKYKLTITNSAKASLYSETIKLTSGAGSYAAFLILLLLAVLI
jgi:hypothetical protein